MCKELQQKLEPNRGNSRQKSAKICQKLAKTCQKMAENQGFGDRNFI